MLKRILPLLFLVSLSFSEFVLSEMSNFWVITAPIAMIVIVLLAIMYMASKALSQPQLEAWTKLELREFLVGAVLIVLVLTVMQASALLLPMLTGHQGSMKDYAVLQLETFTSPLIIAYNSAIEASHHLTLLSGYSFSYPMSLWFFSLSYFEAPYGGYSSLIVMLYHATQGLTNAILIYQTAALLIDFFTSAALAMIPLAFALRLIPFTRQAGTTLIALCLGAFIFLPFSVFLVSEFHKTMSIPFPSISDFSPMKVNIPLGFKEICSGNAKDFASVPGEIWGVAICAPYALTCLTAYAACFAECWQFVTSVFYPMMVTVGQNVYGFSVFAANVASDKNIVDIYNVLKPFLKAVNDRIVLCYIDLILISTITYVGVKSVSSALGGEYFLAGLQRLI
jgi:hypothetical protein